MEKYKFGFELEDIWQFLEDNIGRRVESLKTLNRLACFLSGILKLMQINLKPSTTPKLGILFILWEWVKYFRCGSIASPPFHIDQVDRQTHTHAQYMLKLWIIFSVAVFHSLICKKRFSTWKVFPPWVECICGNFI